MRMKRAVAEFVLTLSRAFTSTLLLVVTVEGDQFNRSGEDVIAFATLNIASCKVIPMQGIIIVEVFEL